MELSPVGLVVKITTASRNHTLLFHIHCHQDITTDKNLNNVSKECIHLSFDGIFSIKVTSHRPFIAKKSARVLTAFSDEYMDHPTDSHLTRQCLFIICYWEQTVRFSFCAKMLLLFSHLEENILTDNVTYQCDFNLQWNFLDNKYQKNRNMSVRCIIVCNYHWLFIGMKI